MIVYELDGQPVGATEMHIAEVTQVIPQWSESPPAPQVPEANYRLSAQQHLERLSQLRGEALQARGHVRARLATLAGPGSEEAMESTVRTLLQGVEAREHQAEADFWLRIDGIKFPQELHFVPFWQTKTFSTAECSTNDFEEAGRRWYCALGEKLELKSMIERAHKKGRPWRKVFKAALTILEQVEDANLAWDRYTAQYQKAARRAGYRGTDAEAPMDSLIAWMTTRVSVARLLPSVTRIQPGTGQISLRNGLLLEACGSAYSLRTDNLPVSQFRALPRTVAASMEKMYLDVSDQMARLQADTQHQVRSLQRAEADTELVLQDGEDLALILSAIESLPCKQRQAILLRAESLSYEEIAMQMGCKMQSVKTHLERARKHLCSKLGQLPRH